MKMWRALIKRWRTIVVWAAVIIVLLVCLAVFFPVPIPHSKNAVTPDQIVSLTVYDVDGLRHSAMLESALAQHASFQVDPKDIAKMFAHTSYRWSPILLWKGSYLCIGSTRDGREFRMIFGRSCRQFEIIGQKGFYVQDRASCMACADVLERARKEAFTPARRENQGIGQEAGQEISVTIPVHKLDTD